MKKTLITLSLILVVGLTATIAYAQTPKIVDEQLKVVSEVNAEYDEWKDWHNERMSWKKAQLNQAVKDKEITEEQAKAWNRHFDDMEEFHRENGPMPGGGCYGGGYRWNNRNGYGLGMMRGGRWGR